MFSICFRLRVHLNSSFTCYMYKNINFFHPIWICKVLVAEDAYALADCSNLTYLKVYILFLLFLFLYANLFVVQHP